MTRVQTDRLELIAKRSRRSLDDMTELWHERAAIREYGYYALRNLGRALITEATSRAGHDPDRAIAMANAYVSLLAADGRARA